MNTIYSQQNVSGVNGRQDFDFVQGFKKAFQTIPENLSKINLPFYFGAGMIIEDGEKESGIESSTIKELQKHFDGKVGAFAYLLMILLYMPCVASIATVCSELNWKWALFMSCYFSALAWLVSTFFYQVMRFSQQPQIATMWIAGVILFFLIFIVALYKRGPVIDT
jgi:ferrous iron transport protein B